MSGRSWGRACSPASTPCMSRTSWPSSGRWDAAPTPCGAVRNVLAVAFDEAMRPRLVAANLVRALRQHRSLRHTVISGASGSWRGRIVIPDPEEVRRMLEAAVREDTAWLIARKEIAPDWFVPLDVREVPASGLRRTLKASRAEHGGRMAGTSITSTHSPGCGRRSPPSPSVASASARRAASPGARSRPPLSSSSRGRPLQQSGAGQDGGCPAPRPGRAGALQNLG